MKRTIIVTGTYELTEDGKKIKYTLHIFGQQIGESVTVIHPYYELVCGGYTALWEPVRKLVVEYFKDEKFKDGAYTNLIDFITAK